MSKSKFQMKKYEMSTHRNKSSTSGFKCGLTCSVLNFPESEKPFPSGQRKWAGITYTVQCENEMPLHEFRTIEGDSAVPSFLCAIIQLRKGKKLGALQHEEPWRRDFQDVSIPGQWKWEICLWESRPHWDLRTGAAVSSFIARSFIFPEAMTIFFVPSFYVYFFALSRPVDDFFGCFLNFFLYCLYFLQFLSCSSCFHFYFIPWYFCKGFSFLIRRHSIIEVIRFLIKLPYLRLYIQKMCCLF